MDHFKGTRVVLTADCTVNASNRTVFPLLCPVREYDWIAPWKADIVHSDSGVVELDCIFTTDFPEEGPDVWIVSRYEPAERLEFVRVNRDRAMRYIVSLTETPLGCRISWTQILTGLTPKGNREIAAISNDTHVAMVENAEKMLSYYLKTGECMSMEMLEGDA